VNEDNDRRLSGSEGMRIRACVVLENRRGKMQSRDITSRREDVKLR